MDTSGYPWIPLDTRGYLEKKFARKNGPNKCLEKFPCSLDTPLSRTNGLKIWSPLSTVLMDNGSNGQRFQQTTVLMDNGSNGQRFKCLCTVGLPHRQSVGTRQGTVQQSQARALRGWGPAQPVCQYKTRHRSALTSQSRSIWCSGGHGVRRVLSDPQD